MIKKLILLTTIVLVGCSSPSSWQLSLEDDLGKQYTGEAMIEGKYIYDSIYENANQSLFFEVNVQSLTSLPEEIQSKKILKYAVLNPDTVVEPEVNKTTTITVDQISIMAEGPPFIRIKE